MKKLLLIAFLIVGCENSTEPEAEDCAGVTGGSAEVDECGVCYGAGFPDFTCDCDGNIADCAGVCGGSAVIDCEGICIGENDISNCP